MSTIQSTQNFAYINKSDVGVTLLTSHLRLKKIEICGSTVRRAIPKVKKIISDIPTYYKMLREYLVKYTEKYPQTTAVIQADNNGCFFKRC